MSLPRLRLGEYVAGGWLVFAVAVFAGAGHWQARLLPGGTPYFPFVHVVLLSLSVSLVRVVLVTSGKLGRLSALLRGSVSATDLKGVVEFDEEARLLKTMLGTARDCLPLYCILLFYPTSDLLIDTLQRSRLVDPALISIDEALFGGHASVWMERFVSPSLTDLMSLCYFLHLIIPPLIVVVAALHAPRALFIEVIEGFVLMSAIGVTLYVAFPAIGPLHTLSHLYSRDLAGGLLTDANRAVIDATRVPRDAFPSLHVAISALLLVYAWRVSRPLGILAAPFIVGNWVSTVYLRYHYLIDVVAGFALVPLVYATVRWWMRRFPAYDGLRPGREEKPPQRGVGSTAEAAT